jgi:hypothetical protein
MGSSTPTPGKRHQKLMFCQVTMVTVSNLISLVFKLQSKTENLSTNKRMAIGILGIIARPLQAWGGLHCVNLNKKKMHKILKAKPK